ncbi:hypothetical protein I6F40_08265 [Pseudoalteromonas sp. SWXJ133]|uniref:hypothetical protein n=1 Tax=unclassified Pseudoalteromonas TaxID=194690 RepID=UPI001407492B|nr:MULTISPECIES: hypothetical protein [unclassified Pseudoalteromonas]MBH0020350.1 hypothetical protein [Pseudoalteromonas sp. SWXJ133]
MAKVKNFFLLTLLLLSACSYVTNETEVERRYKNAGSLMGTALACENNLQIINSSKALEMYISKQELAKYYTKEKLDYFLAVHDRVAMETWQHLDEIKAKIGKPHKVCQSPSFKNNTTKSLYRCIHMGEATVCL